jgi:hypothetical protein
LRCLVALATIAWPHLLQAQPAPELSVSGALHQVGDDLEVEATVTNHRRAAIGSMSAEAELLGQRQKAALRDDLPPSASGRLVFRFPLDFDEPGVYPMSLLLDYSEAGTPSTLLSQRAFLLLALGAPAEPPVKIVISPLRLRTYATLRVGLESADGAAHRVRLRTETARGLRALAKAEEVDVPAHGSVQREVGLLRAGAPRGPQGLLVIAETTDASPHRTAVATGTVEVVVEEPWLKRLRPALAVTVALLVAWSLVAELRRRRQA